MRRILTLGIVVMGAVYTVFAAGTGGAASLSTLADTPTFHYQGKIISVENTSPHKIDLVDSSGAVTFRFDKGKKKVSPSIATLAGESSLVLDLDHYIASKPVSFFVLEHSTLWRGPGDNGPWVLPSGNTMLEPGKSYRVVVKRGRFVVEAAVAMADVQ